MSIVKRLVGPGLREFVFRSGIAERRLRASSGRWVLMVHGVCDDEISRDAFAADLAWLAAHFCVVKLETMIQSLSSGEPPAAGGEVAITFDDGLRNQALQAYPVLRELGVPATIFVCPGLIDTGAWLWNHEARARLRRQGPSQWESWANRTGGCRSASVDDIVERWKQLPAAQRRALELELRHQTEDFQPTQREREAFDIMSWEDVTSLDPELITFGSHTVSHPILPSLDDAELEFEIRSSREMLEAKLGRSVSTFCYPNGSSDLRARRTVAQTYSAAVTTHKAMVPAKADPMAIPRVAIESSRALLAWRMMRLAH